MKRVTFIGLGKMGAAMATRLLEMGVPLTVYNRSQSKAQVFAQKGAQVAPSIAEAVSNADIIISCLFDDRSVIETSVGDTGIIAHMKPSSIHIGTATILPSTGEQLHDEHQKHNKHYISTAVLGVSKVAYAGKLITYYAGKQQFNQDCEQILGKFSERVIHMGEAPKLPLVMKTSMNYSLLTMLELISELYVFAEKSDVDIDIIQQSLHEIYGSPVFKRYIDKIKARDFDDVNFDMACGLKDVSTFQAALSNKGVVPKLGDILKGRYLSAMENGMEDKDWSGIYEMVRKESGL